MQFPAESTATSGYLPFVWALVAVVLFGLLIALLGTRGKGGTDAL